MKKYLFSVFVMIYTVLFCILLQAQPSTPWFTSHPTLTPDGQTIIFSYETDLWKVPSSGGQAVRLTAMDGMETRPAVSPNGKWLAFSSSQYGNMDLYVMPLEGGEISRLTWHQAADEVEGWSWDSKSVYFTSARENRFSSWKVSHEGGTPQRLFRHYHVTDHNLAAHPEGYYLFNTSWESKNQAHRKRYRGSFAPQIEAWHPGNNEYKMLTDHDGKDMWPSVDENGVIYFVSDEYNGEYNLYRIKEGEKEQLTSFDTSIKHPRVSANGEKVVFTRDYQIWLYDVASGESGKVEFLVFGNSTLEKDQDFRVQGNITAFDVSPDKKKLAFVSRGELFVSDADGKYIYFQTNRTQPSFPYGMRDSDIYRIALTDIQPEFRSDRVNRLFADDEDSGNNDKPEGAAVIVEIEEERLRERWERIGPGFGSQSSPFVYVDGEKTYVLYRSNHSEGRNTWWKTVLEAFESPKTEMIGGTQMGSGGIVEADGSHWVLLGGDIHKLNISGGSVEKVDARYTFRRSLRDEFDQMFDEMWANLETNFYESDFHGIDWEEVREHYRQFLPHVRTRADLREMKNDMLGELNTSHIGFSSSGGEEQVFYGSTTLATGILFEADDPFVVSRTVRNSPAFRSAVSVEPGDRLIRVNGTDVDPAMNRESYFSFPSSMAEVTLTFRRGNSEFDLKLEPVSFFAVRNLLYDEWLHERQQIVDEQSEKRIAYVHMKNMGQGELQHFMQEMVQQGEERDALIFDLRYNTGGNVHDEVLRFLSQRPYLQWGYRDGRLANQSNFTPSAKPIVMLINEQSLSDAEMTAAGFKELGLGTVMGMETYRWIIFTSGRSLVDGSSYRLPTWGVYSFDGDNLEFTGVAPDIEIPKTFDDRMNDRDPQLDRAIQYILEQLD
jgi:C-terminal processing protease CtpA/Prc/Tol biopolymer transport system component